MGVSFSGYVKTGEYEKNTDGTFTCKVNYITDVTKPTVISVQSIKCIGVSNVNNFKSPNRPNQMIIMSNDNKYIFFPLDVNSNTILISDYSIIYYISLAIVNYNIQIPDNFNYVHFISNISKFTAPTDDPTYNSLPNNNRKTTYKGYLMGQNPPNSLLTINSDSKVWSDIGYIFKAGYDLNIPESSTNYVSPSYCIKIDSPTVLSNVSQYDCRSNVKASPIIPKTSLSLLSLDTNTYGIIAVVVCIICCLMCTCGCMLIIMMSSKSKKK